MEAAIRAFVAVTLAPKLLAEIETIQRRLNRAIGRDLVRWTRPDQLHLTLKFFGNLEIGAVPDITKALHEAAREISTFRLTVEEPGVFPSIRRPSVIWLGIGGDVESLRQLQAHVERLTAGAGSHSEDRAFHPHLTIGRVRGRDQDTSSVGPAIHGVAVPEFSVWPVRDVHLVQSTLSQHGSIYASLATIPLKDREHPETD